MLDDLKKLHDEEQMIKQQIDWIYEQQKRVVVLHEQVRAIRRLKAEKIRELYFSRQAKQSELAKAVNMRQGNISRIISNQVYDRYYK